MLQVVAGGKPPENSRIDLPRGKSRAEKTPNTLTCHKK